MFGKSLCNHPSTRRQRSLALRLESLEHRTLLCGGPFDPGAGGAIADYGPVRGPAADIMEAPPVEDFLVAGPEYPAQIQHGHPVPFLPIIDVSGEDGLVTLCGTPGYASETIISSGGSSLKVQKTIFGADGRVIGTSEVWYINAERIVFSGSGCDEVVINNSSLSLEAFGNGGNDTLVGGSGEDSLWGGGGGDYLEGGGGDDAMWGCDGRDTMHGGGGHDVMFGGRGHDRLFGEGGQDWLFGGEDNDWIDGGTGNDVLYGEEGNDCLLGGAHDDELRGGIGNDWLFGQDGDDWFDGGAGSDRMYGGIGDDTFDRCSRSEDFVHGGPGNDTFYWIE